MGLAARKDELTVAAAVNGEETLFELRKAARAGQRAQLRERISQSNEEVVGLTAQQQSKEKEIKLIGEELVGVTDLYKKNLVSISRFMQLQREQTRLEGERGQLIADIARARAKISETELQIIQLDQDFRTEVLKDLRETQGKIAELVERMVAAEDQLKRIDIRSPRSGIVNSLTIHTVGGVIGNGETIMQIVPQGDELTWKRKLHRRISIRSGSARGLLYELWRAISARCPNSMASLLMCPPISPASSRAPARRHSLLPRTRVVVRGGGRPPW